MHTEASLIILVELNVAKCCTGLELMKFMLLGEANLYVN